MKKLGQHFLRNAQALQTIVDTLALKDGDRVIEIGAGHGELTVPLSIAARDKRCEIVCIEKDHALIEGLALLAAKALPRTEIKIIEGDALTLLPGLTAADNKLVGNIPYYITGKLLRVMSELEEKPERAVLLVQKEVALRICAAAPHMNRLAAAVQFWAEPTIVAMVPRNDFSPPPDVDSAIIVLGVKRPQGGTGSSTDPALYYRAIRAIFAQPRKTLLNNLVDARSDKRAKTATKSAVIAQLERLGIDPGARPQDLGIAQIAAIARAPLWG